MVQIRTKWHHVMDLIDKDEVYLTAPSGGKAKHVENYGIKKLDTLKAFLKDISDLPRFVVSRELMELAGKPTYTESMLDMKQAGVLNMPFAAQTVEFEWKNSHQIVMLRDLRQHSKNVYTWEIEAAVDTEKLATEMGWDFYAVRMSVEKDKDGEYFVVSPSVCYLQINHADEAPEDTKAKWKRKKGERAWIRMNANPHDLFAGDSELAKLTEATWQKDSGTAFYAACATYLLINTAGVAKEVIETEKINRQRRNSGKTLIPTHTYLRIGRVYRSASSDETDEYIPRKSPRPHWRRGHLRNVRYGEGRQLIKQQFIHAKLVAFHGDAKPTTPDYRVSK
jgi:hypothetical protein